ncbi:hypothetical protein ACFW9O_12115 [Streptomyces sp. NPDC059499]|uniref:hypothetical protein n=1 Tax=Streptomyces sp. NPDC059499 TaxID=3346852 RepID=UPI0036845D70
MDDRAVAVVGHQRPRHGTAMPQVPREVVLEHERAGRARHIEDLAAPSGRQYGAGRVVFRTLLFGGGALGGLFTGLLSGRIGSQGALAWAATGSAAVLIPLALSPVSRLRGLPPTPEEPVPTTVAVQEAG